MPYDLGDLASNTAECVTPLGITVIYRLANVTPRVLRQLNEMPDGNLSKLADVADQADRLADLVHTLVTRWDVTRNGEPVPLTADALVDVRIEILMDVIQAIVGDAGPNPQTGTASPRLSRGPSGPASGGSSRKRG